MLQDWPGTENETRRTYFGRGPFSPERLTRQNTRMQATPFYVPPSTGAIGFGRVPGSFRGSGVIPRFHGHPGVLGSFLGSRVILGFARWNAQGQLENTHKGPGVQARQGAHRQDEHSGVVAGSISQTRRSRRALGLRPPNFM